MFRSDKAVLRLAAPLQLFDPNSDQLTRSAVRK
jgi:hypothetical protein